ncbi:IMP dehydrogenase [Rhodococcus sp. 06-156-3C]|nr:IMP dehydrogenase [Rhodococcus sp. 06-156-4a]OZD18115.1 IMP dehydrogenase [Rhodococcus sp. 06-156-3C]OZD20728.1 IMP dehydrogenase [Rhodococcus sp. 06-156-4C]OZD30732.1 IMP dehydrogenase [Rhodococcus sp. 06-156-3b]OZD32673.1 IMP dehydrogenase [Rhodococcus sp. 06-156-3]OZF65095.1 IMP dehydrogenase [Rhodococcus sp. 06-156-4]
MYAPGDVRVETVPDAAIIEPTDAIVRNVRGCICGSDLHPYHSMEASTDGRAMGHEMIGVVEEIGSAVSTLKKGDFVIAPFVMSDNTCSFCRDGLQTSCKHGAFFGSPAIGGTQAEYQRIAQADGTLVVVPGIDDKSDLLPSLLTLSDVYLTGYHAAVMGKVEAGKTVTVIGDGAVGLSAVLASKQLGAERIILMGRHKARTDIGIDFGATDIVADRGEDGIAQVMELTGGEGSHIVLEAVGLMPAYEQSYGIVRPGGVISRVGAPQYEDAPVGFSSLFAHNVTLTGGIAPVRAYIEQAIPQVLEGDINPGRVFDKTVAIDDVPSGYAAMDTREALKVLIEF